MKTIFAATMLCLMQFIGSQLQAQAPAISYPSGNKVYTPGTAIASLSPTNTGGAVAAPGTLATVSTLAGSGTAGSTDGSGTSARFNVPFGVAVDGLGNVYVADYINHKIRKITSAGVVSTLAGSGAFGSTDGAGTAASFNFPTGVAVDGSGNVYVADQGNHKIRKITPAGVVSTFAGSGTAGSNDGSGTAASFYNPTGVAVDGSGNVYVADQNNHKIRKVTSTGVVSTLAGSGTLGSTDGSGMAASFNGPFGVAVDGSGNVYVADYNNNKIRKITSTGVVSTLAGSGASGSTDGSGTAASFNGPAGVAVDGSGNVYVADYINNKIRKITSAGVVSTLAGSGALGSTDGSGTSARFNFPTGVAVDGSGNVYVADYNNNKIRKIITTGGYSISPALPSGLGIDAATGIISGTPTVVSAAQDYTVTASNASGSGTTTINIAVLSNNANLSGLSMSSGTLSPVFAAATTSYTATVANSVGSITATPALADANASVTVNGTAVTSGSASGSIALNVGANTITVTVTAQDGSTKKTYTVTVTRDIPPPSISYPSGNKVYTPGTAIASLSPTNTGGAVAAPGTITVSTLAGSGASGSTDGSGMAASFNFPFGVAVDGSGNVYVADKSNHKIRKITPAGVVSTLAGSGASGSTDGTGTAASFNGPVGVAVDGSGNVYVADYINNKIRKITPAGVVSTLAGSGASGSTDGSGTAARFNAPSGVAVDGSGNVYVADQNNNKIRKVTSAGVVSTLAGSGTAGSTDGSGTAARFYYPTGVAVDGSGNVYVADYNNNKIRKITSAGVVSTLAGSGTAGSTDGSGTAARFYGPNGVAVDGLGNAYVAEDNHKIRKITPAGVVSTLAGSGTTGSTDGSGTSARFFYPNGVAVDGSGNVYVADLNNHKIRKITSAGGYSIGPALPSGLSIDDATGIISGTPTVVSAAQDYTVTASNASGAGTTTINIAVLSNNANLSGLSMSSGTLSPVFAAATTSYTATVANSVGSITITPTVADATAVVTVNGTAVTSGSACGSIALNVGTNTITVIVTAQDGITTKNYTVTVTRDIPPPSISYPAGNKVYSTGTAITPLSPTNTGGAVASPVIVSTFAGSGTAGSTDGSGISASFNNPNGVALDGSGNVYVADINNNKIRKISLSGVVSTLAGNGTAGSTDGSGTAASFYNPTSVAVDGSGNVYVADYSNNKIRKISPAGVVSTFAGSGTAGSSDGSGTAASFNSPYGVAVDGFGNVYVADNNNHKIRKISPAGVVSTLAGNGTAGSSDGTGTAVSFNYPGSLALDGSGNIYVPDRFNHKIRKISPAGVVSTFAGSGTAGSSDGTSTAASFYYPGSVAVDGSGNVYVTDNSNNKIRKISPNGVVSTLAGIGTSGSSDGIGMAASFYFPSGVAVDGSGNIYVADRFNNKIRKTTTTGEYAITPSLPAGLGIDATTGIISGTPTAVAVAQNYTVTASNNSGTGTAIINIAVLSNNANLSSLALSAGTLTPVFASNTLVYTANVTNSISSITITPAIADATAAVTVNGTTITSGSASSIISLNEGSNTITIVVTAQDGATTKTYTVKVIRSLTPPGNALSFDGVDDYVDLGTPTALNANNIKTMECWVKFNSLTVDQEILSRSNIGSGTDLLIYNNNLSFFNMNSTTNATSYISYPVSNLQLGKWYHIAATWDGSTKESMLLYLNGVSVGTRTDNGNINVGGVSNPSGTFKIGNWSSTTVSRYFNGSIDEVRIWNVNRTASQIQANMVNGVSPASSGLVTYYDFDYGVASGSNAGSSTLYDLTSNAYHGALNNFALSGALSNFVESYAMVVPMAKVATNVGSTSFTANWTAPLFGTVTNYLLDVSTSSTLSSNIAGSPFTVASGTTSQIITGLSPVTTYYYRVRADKNSVTGQGGNSGTITVTTPSNNANLSGLSLSNGSLSPSFLPSTINYSSYLANVISSITVTPTLSNAYATITVNGTAVASGSASGTISLNVGSNTILVIVTAQDGTTTKTYTVTITREIPSPAISYTSGNKVYNTGTAITALSPTNTGGAVAAPGSIASTVNTFSGSGATGSSNGSSTAASFNSPLSIAVYSGIIYVADAANNKIRKISLGVVSTFAGNDNGYIGSSDGAGTAASFFNPSGIGVDGSGNVYVADAGNNLIRKISPAGLVSTFAGSGTAGSSDGVGTAASFNNPKGVAVDASGYVYVADRGNNKIRRISPSGAVYTLAGSGIAGSTDGSGTTASFNSPTGVAVDASNNVYVADWGNNKIRKINFLGTVTVSTLAGSGTAGNNDGIGIAASFDAPYNLAVDDFGNLYLTDFNNNKIRNISPSGVVTTLVGIGTPGSSDGSGITASFYGPSGVAVEGSGSLYVADYYNNKIRKITTTGGYGISPVLPSGLAINAATGIISGTPTAVVAAKDYTVTASNINGASTATINIATVSPTNNANLSALTLSNGGLTPFFLTGTLNYSSYVVNDISSITVTPTRSDANATITVNGTPVASGSASGSIPLSVGINTINVQVTAQDGTTTKSYTVTITREVPPPAISYPSGNKVYSTSTNIAPLNPTNVGGAVAVPGSSNVSTFAGSGTAGNSDGNSTVASFTSPSGVAVDLSGNVYVADRINNKIRKISPTGLVSTFAGSGTAGSSDGFGTAASFNSPTGVAINGSGNIYVADANNNKIRLITSSGYVSTLAGNGTAGSSDGTGTAASFNYPTGVAVDVLGNVYVADRINNKIRKISPTGLVSTFAGSGALGSSDGTGTAATFANPTGVAVDLSYNVYVVDYGAHKIRKISSTGAVSIFAGNSSGGSIDGSGISASFYFPSGIAVDGSGNVYVADRGNNKIRKISSTGIVSTLAGSGTAGSGDGVATVASFFNPYGVAVDGSGNVYVADENSNNIRKITTNKGYTCNLPEGLSIDATTGIISGRPTLASAAKDYTITASNAAGISSTTINITVLSGNTNLSNLVLSAGTLSPAFTFFSGLNYTASVANGIGVITVTPTLSDANATVTVNGIAVANGSASSAINLNVGSNVISILVTAQDGTTTQTYTVTVTRNIAAPAISYLSGNKVYTSGTTITSLNPINLGGAVAAPSTLAIVSTFAGNGTAGSSDGTGIAARFNAPYSVAVDGSGNVYVAEYSNHKIRKISPAGMVSTFAGSGIAGSSDGTGTAARFKNPAGVSVDGSGNVYVADAGNHKVRKISPAGVVSTLAGSGTAGSADGTGSAASFNNPSGVVVDASGNIYVAEVGNHNIRKISPAGVVSTFAGSGMAGNYEGNGTAASFYNPIGVAVDSSGNVYVADRSNNKIRKISPLGDVSTFAGSGTSGSSDGIGTAASFAGPSGIALDGSGNIYVSEGSTNNKIRKISPAGVVSTLAGSGTAGSTDGIGTAASFKFPSGLTVDGSGNIYVADNNNNKIRKIINGGGYGISPTLPTGLGIDATTGIISGTPTAVSTAQDYTITALNAIGTGTTTINIAVIPPSTNANLSGLSLSSGSLSPVFAAANTSYTATVDNIVSSITVSATVADTTATVTVNGTAVASGNASGAININVGSNTISVLVTAQDGTTTQAYIITVTRVAPITWTGATNTDWNTASNWSTGTSPTGTDNVVIATASNQPIVSTTQSVNNVTINSGATLTVTGTLNIGGTVSNSGTFTATAGTVAFNGTTGLQTIAANTFSGNTINNLIINNAAGVSLGGTLNITGALTPTAGTLTTGGFLTIKSDANATGAIASGSGTYISGNVTVERFIQSNNRKKYVLVSSPVNSPTIYNAWQEGGQATSGFGTQITGPTGSSGAGFDAISASGLPSIFTYNDNNATGSKWTGLNNTNATTLGAGKGYLLFVRGDRTITPSTSTSKNTILRATGTISQGSVSPTLSNTGASRFNLIANPYASLIDWTTGITKNNLQDMFVVYDPNTEVFVTYSGGTVSPANANVTKYLQSGQAFFVYSSAASPSITFTEASKSTVPSTAANTTLFGADGKSQLSVNVLHADGSLADGVVAIFKDGYMKGIGTEDAPKLDNLGETFSLINGTSSLSIEGRPMVKGNDTLSFAMGNFGKKTYTLEIAAANFTGETAMLIDNYTGTKLPLDMTGTTRYAFTVNGEEASAANSRFQIAFGSTTTYATADNAATGLQISVSPNPVADKATVSFTLATAGDTEVRILNTLGQTVDRKSAGNVSKGTASFSLKQIAAGVYTVQLLSGGKVVGTKKLVKE